MKRKHKVGLWIDKNRKSPYLLIRALNEEKISVLMHTDLESALSTYRTASVDFVVTRVDINDHKNRNGMDLLSMIDKGIPRILYGDEFTEDLPQGVVYFHVSEVEEMLDYIISLSSG